MQTIPSGRELQFDDDGASETEMIVPAEPPMESPGSDYSRDRFHSTHTGLTPRNEDGSSIGGLDRHMDVFGENAALFESEAAEREAHLSANIMVGYRAPRGVKPHGWLGSAAMMGVEAWLSCINWSVLYGFHQSVFWHFTGARKYGDVLCGDAVRPCEGVSEGVGWGSAVACAVVLLPLVLEVPSILRFVTGRHNLLTLSTTVLLSVTVVADALASGEALRTVLLGVGSASVMLSLAAVASCPAVNPRLRRQPWAVVLGLLILLCIRFGRASAHPLLQAEGDRTLFVKLLGCATGIICSLIIIKEGKGCCAKVDRTPEEEMAKLKKALNRLEEQYAVEGHKLSSELAKVSRARAESTESAAAAKAAGTPGVTLQHSSSLHPEIGSQHKDYRKVYEKYTNMRSKLQLYKVTARDNDYGRETKRWLWLLVGPPLASALTLTLWLFTSAGLIGRLVGVQPFRHSAGLLLVGMSFGLGLNGLLTMHGVLLQAWATVLVAVGMALMLHTDGDAGYAGGVILSIALPSVWWITLGAVRKLAVHGAVGRVFGCAAVFLWFFLLLYSAAELGTAAPIFSSAVTFHGTLVPFGWIVSSIWMFCTIGEWLIDYHHGLASANKLEAQQADKQKLASSPATNAAVVLLKIERPRLCRLHKQSLWKPFLSAWMPAVVVMAAISLFFISTVLMWNASQMWLVDISHDLDAVLEQHNFTIATFNVAGGYDSQGSDSTACVAHLLQQIAGDSAFVERGMAEVGEYSKFDTHQRLRTLPLLIGLQESETVTWTRGNRDLLGSIARGLSLHEFFGQTALRPAATGVGTLSQLPLREQAVVPFATAAGAETEGQSRVFTRVSVDLGSNVTLSLINTQLGFSVDGKTQRSQIDQLLTYVSDSIEPGAPVVITADMHLFADGKSTDVTGNPDSAWDALREAGFNSVTPLNVGIRQPLLGDMTYFESSDGRLTTIDFSPCNVSSSESCDEAVLSGLQLDYIWYRGLELAVDDPKLSQRLQPGWAVPEATLCDEDECAIPVQLEENLGLGHWTTPAAGTTGSVACSYHRPIVAAFRRP